MTDFVIDEIEDVLPYAASLDGPRLLEARRARQADRQVLALPGRLRRFDKA
jgi:hypothetical protein